MRWRRGTAAEWTAADPILLDGEPGYETDTGKLKVGDGSTSWTGLSYYSAGGGFVPDPSGEPDNKWLKTSSGALIYTDPPSGAIYGTPAIVLGTAAAAGSTDEAIRRDSTIVAFDATVPTTQAFGDSAATGSAAVAARRDHKHAMPATPTTVSGNAGTATALQTGRTIDGQTFDGTANITVIAPGTHAATTKATPADADEFPLVDSAASNVLKKFTGTNLKAYLKSYFDTLYAAGSAGILASAYYNPSGGTVSKTTTSTLTAIDTTNLRATFTAPASGNVIVKVGIGRCNPNNCNPHLGVLDGSTTKGTAIMAPSNGEAVRPAYASFKITGLTPGNTYSYDLAIVDSNAISHATFQYGFTTSNLADGTGPAFIEVWSA